jgi:hypothetical protein
MTEVANLAPPAAAAPAAAPVAAPTAQAQSAPAPLLNREEPAASAATGETTKSWLDDLPDDLRADKTLQLFKDKGVDELARGLVERQKMLGGRVELPKADDPDSFTRFAAAIRPEKAENYQIELPEGQDATYADHMRNVFFDAGLHPIMADKVVAGNNAFWQLHAQAAAEAGATALDNVKTSMGAQEFEIARQATNNMLNRIGVPISFDTDLERFAGGAENSIRILLDLGRRSGELGKVDPIDIQLSLGQFSPEAAQKELNAVANDPVRAKILTGPDGEEKAALQRRMSVLINIVEAHAKKGG